MDELFRQEAIEHRASRLLGEISLAQPLSWTIATGVITASIIGAALALIFVQVPRLATVSAVITRNGATMAVPREAHTGMIVRVRPNLPGADKTLVGLLQTSGDVGVGRVTLNTGAVRAGTPAEATIVMGREPLGAALF